MDAESASSAVFNLKKDFVLKLRLVGAGGPPQIRRVKLNRIAVNGSISYDALVAIAIQATFPESETINPDAFAVALTYYDSDNDCITIASSDELVDAIEQMESVLRITTDVKRKKAPKNQGKTVKTATKLEKPSARPPSRATKTVPPPPPRSPHAIGAMETNAGTRAAQLQGILESFVGVLATAVVALQTQLHAAGVAPPAPTISTPVAPSSVPEAKPVGEEKEVVNEEDVPSAPRPFIHGRHTCDSCLATPIVGLRYNAVNLPDYDLCANCFDNYKGDDIKFEAVELDRDRVFQDRWHRKRAKFGGRDACRGPRGPHGSHRRHHGRRHSRVGRCAESPAVVSAEIRADGVDACLKEAIRRSLRDVSDAIDEASVAMQKDVSKTNQDIKKSGITETSAAKETVTSCPVEEKTFHKTEEASVVSAPLEETEELGEAVFEAEEPEREKSFSSDAEGSGDVAEELGRTFDHFADAINSVVSEIERSVKTSVEDTESIATAGEHDKDGESVVVAAEEDKTEEDIVVKPEEGVSSVAGATVVSGEEGDNRSEGSWDVVGGEDQLVQDEMLARAAQMIGSALFESGNAETSGAPASTLTNSDVMSMTSSIPSEVPTLSSEVPAASRDRWAVQLSQLRELGFFDEAKNVETLERLYAANIGVDSDDEVTVTQVVNELFKQN